RRLHTAQVAISIEPVLIGVEHDDRVAAFARRCRKQVLRAPVSIGENHHASRGGDYRGAFRREQVDRISVASPPAHRTVGDGFDVSARARRFGSRPDLMQQSHETRLCLRRQQVADLSDNAPLRRGAAPIHRKTVQETVVIIEGGNQVRAGKNVARSEVFENSSRLDYLVRYARIHFRVGHHIEARRTRGGMPPLPTVSFRRLSEPTGYQNEDRQLEKLRRHAQAASRSPMTKRFEHVSKPTRILASFPSGVACPPWLSSWTA